MLRNLFIAALLGVSASLHAQSITITASGTTICAGTTVTFTATPSGVGTPHYQWLKNSVAVGTDAATYASGALANGDVVMCELVTTPGGTILALSGPVVMTVDNPVTPAPISGSATVCVGSTTTLTDATTGGVWASSHPLTASISSGGVVTGSAPGLDTITYTVTNACGSASVSHVITVMTPPFLLPIGGPNAVCLGSSITLTDTTGGTWSSVSPSIATVSSSGVVTGVGHGFDTVVYSATNACGTTTRRKVISVQIPVAAGPITGSSTLCQGDTIHLAGAVNGGTWISTNNAIANFGAGPGGNGVLRGNGGGNVTVAYVVTNSCGSDTAVKTITVTPLPFVFPIAGSRDSVCPGSTLPLVEYTTGGIWSSKNTAFATVDASGMVTGVGAGVDTIFYSLTNGCGTTTRAYALYVYCPHDVSVPAVAAAAINVYPNPASNTITVDGIAPARITLTNLYGQEVISVTKTNTLNVAGLAAGMYYLSVFDEDGKVVARENVVKQ